MELRHGCGALAERLLRLVCPRTCGCAEPQGLPWFKVEAQGCPTACRAEAMAAASQLACHDAATEVSVSQQARAARRTGMASGTSTRR